MTTWTAVVVLVGTAVAMPWVRRELVRRQLLDHPNLRSSHEVPTPRGGGIGVLVGLTLGAVVLTLAGAGRTPATGAVAAVASGALALGLLGWLDDVRGLGAAPRLAAQVLVGVGVGGFVADGPPSLGYAVCGALALPVAVNAVNFMDGIDGITGATMVVWGATLVFAGWRHGQPEVALLGAGAGAAALGFLPFNVPVARLFLGDVGSYAFGALVGGTTLLAAARGVPWPLLLAPLLPYLVDVTLTLARRARRRAPLLSAHREHVYQVLSARSPGGHTSVAAGMAALAAGCATVAAAATGGTAGAGAGVGVGVGVVGTVVTIGLVLLVGGGFAFTAARLGRSERGRSR